MVAIDGQRMVADETLLQRIERRRADIAEHDADRADGERAELFLMAVVKVGFRRDNGLQSNAPFRLSRLQRAAGRRSSEAEEASPRTLRNLYAGPEILHRMLMPASPASIARRRAGALAMGRINLIENAAKYGDSEAEYVFETVTYVEGSYRKGVSGE